MRKVLYILGQLEDEDVSWLSRTGRRRDLAERDVIITQGIPAFEIFIVLQGLLAVSIGGKKVAELGPGEIVGEMSLVDKRPPGATVSAIRLSSVLVIDRGLLEDKLGRDFGFAARFYRAIAIFLSSRLRASAAQVGDNGSGAQSLEDEEELDLEIMDNLHMAGLRFEDMMKSLMQARSGL